MGVEGKPAKWRGNRKRNSMDRPNFCKDLLIQSQSRANPRQLPSCSLPSSALLSLYSLHEQDASRTVCQEHSEEKSHTLPCTVME